MVLLLSACGIDTSGLATGGDDSGVVGDDATGSTETGGGGTDASMPTPDASDASKDVAPPVDAPHDAIVPKEGSVDGCVPTGPENCTNGLDDDCNGLTDCQDPACTGAGYTCVPDPSTAVGWSFAPLNPSARPACPSPLSAAYVDVNPTNLSSPASCSCTCNVGTQPDCEQGNINAGYGNGNCNNPFVQSTGGGACHNDPGGIGIDSNVSATSTPSGGTCAASVSQTIPANGETQGETCAGETTFGKGCGSGQVCALVPAGFSTCVVHAGALACPGGAYTMANAVGTVVDSRALALHLRGHAERLVLRHLVLLPERRLHRNAGRARRRRHLPRDGAERQHGLQLGQVRRRRGQRDVRSTHGTAAAHRQRDADGAVDRVLQLGSLRRVRRPSRSPGRRRCTG